MSDDIQYAEQPEAVIKQIKSDAAAHLALEIQGKLVSAGHEAYLVGGCVRDVLSGRTPKDYDIATSAHPEQVSMLFPDAVAVGQKFGVMLVWRNGRGVEVATFRQDGVYRDGRRPETISFSGIQEDSNRRDFTVNAMYFNPLSREVKDFHGGQEDLHAKRLRCVGVPELRFREDALRLLRALRFAANLGFEIDADTMSGIVSEAGLIAQVSAERCRDELVLGFTGPNPARFLDLLDTSGILTRLMPEVSALHGCEQPPEFHPEGDVYIHTRLMLDLMKPNPNPVLAFSVLFHDIGKPLTRTVSDRIRFNGHAIVGAELSGHIGRRLRFSNHQVSAIEHIVLRHMDFINVPKMRESTLKRFLAHELIEDELELHRVDCLASHKDLSTYQFAQEQLIKLRSLDNKRAALPRPLVTGSDLINLGLKPGPLFKVLLDQVFDHQLENPTATREDCLNMALTLISEMG